MKKKIILKNGVLKKKILSLSKGFDEFSKEEKKK